MITKDQPTRWHVTVTGPPTIVVAPLLRETKSSSAEAVRDVSHLGAVRGAFRANSYLGA